MNYSSVYNFYEHLVFEYINETLLPNHSVKDEDFFLDVSCYALTRLPSRYIRHEIDMAYYLAPGERTEMENRVAQTVDAAAEFILDRLEKGVERQAREQSA